MAEKNYNIYLVGNGKHVGWTQGSPFGPVYDEKGGCTGDAVVHNPGSDQLLLHKSEQKVTAQLRWEK